MPKGVYLRNKMQDTEGAAPAAPAPDMPEAASSFEDTVLALLSQITGQVQALSTRVDVVEEKATLRLTGPRIDAHSQDTDRTRRALAANPDGIPHSQTIPTFPNGQLIPDMVMAEYRPLFGSGDVVALNLDAVPHGRDDGKTRGELMVAAGVPNGYGEILDRIFLSDRKGIGWKYRVKFDKTVMPGSNGGIVALHEQELLHA